jgi:hypothetical protein
MSKSLKELFASIHAPHIGEYWEGQGGFLIGLMPGEGGQSPYLLIRSEDEAVDLTWGAYGKSEPEAASRYDGAANTQALVQSQHAHPAAQWAAAYTKDGHRDFYLPAQRELNLCYATLPSKFAPEWYWTSTQYSAYGAWLQYFYGGDQYGAYEDYEGRAVAVRRLVLQ